MQKKINPYILAIAASSPFVLVAVSLILPTFDDWNTLSSPNYDSNFIKYLLPYGTTWRPGDAMFGYINAINSRLYPLINHIIIFLGHLASTALVYKITGIAGMRPMARNMAMVFFYISPCVCGTIFSCDALNQTYSHLWGMLAVYSYLVCEGKRKYLLWTLCVMLAALSKDNGIAWSIVPPIVAFAFGKEDKRSMARNIGIGILISISYVLIRLSVPHTVIHNGSHIEQMLSFGSKIKGLATWIGYTWIAADYICLMHEPSRNILYFLLTALLSTPFVAACFLGKPKLLVSKSFLSLSAAMLITASANLLISMSIMNAYCSLGMAAIIIGYLVDGNQKRENIFRKLFYLYIIVAIAVDAHHWYKSWKTSLPAKTIAEEIIAKTGKKADNVYCILVHNEKNKFSSFCVPVDEAVGWGGAMVHYNGYKWPKIIKDTTINSSDATKDVIRNIADRALRADYECVWVIGENGNMVIRNTGQK